MNTIGKTILALSLSLLCGCASAPPWEDADIDCIDYANASCRAAMIAGNPSGVVSCTMPGTFERHAVTWVQVGGKRIYWDNSWKCPRTREDLGTIHGETIGPSKGAFDLCPMPGGPAK